MVPNAQNNKYDKNSSPLNSLHAMPQKHSVQPFSLQTKNYRLAAAREIAVIECLRLKFAVFCSINAIKTNICGNVITLMTSIDAGIVRLLFTYRPEKQPAYVRPSSSH